MVAVSFRFVFSAIHRHRFSVLALYEADKVAHEEAVGNGGVSEFAKSYERELM